MQMQKNKEHKILNSDLRLIKENCLQTIKAGEATKDRYNWPYKITIYIYHKKRTINKTEANRYLSWHLKYKWVYVFIMYRGN